MDDAPSRLLLDTHVLMWFVLGTLSPAASHLLIDTAAAGGLLVSPITAWELGLLAGDGRDDRPRLDASPADWYRRAINQPGLGEAPFTGTIAMASTCLPGTFHRDPADRFLVATARELGIPIVTSDRKILHYAAAGNVAAVAC